MKSCFVSLPLIALIAGGCLIPRTDTFLVQGSRFQAMPPDWRNASFAVHEFKGDDGEVRTRVFSNQLEAELRKVGFTGRREALSAELMVFWSAGNNSEVHAVQGSRTVQVGGGTAESRSIVSGDNGSSLISTTTELPSQNVALPTLNQHTITAYTVEVVVLDTRRDPADEVFRSRCLIKAIDQPVGQPFGLATTLIFEGFPGAPTSQISKELNSLPQP